MKKFLVFVILLVCTTLFANNVEDFMSGYSTFVFGNILSTDVPALKQHIHDGAVEYQKILKERNS